MFVHARPHSHIIHLLLLDEQVESNLVQVGSFIESRVGMREGWLDSPVSDGVDALAHEFAVLFRVVTQHSVKVKYDQGFPLLCEVACYTHFDFILQKVAIF